MAEEQVTPQALVLQNDYDKMVVRLQNKRLDEKVSNFFRIFFALSRSFFGFDKDQLEKFSINELKVLDKLICRKARPWAIGQILFTFGVPIFGWLYALYTLLGKGECYSWLYLRQRKYLKIHREDFMLEIFQKLKS